MVAPARGRAPQQQQQFPPTTFRKEARRRFLQLTQVSVDTGGGASYPIDTQPAGYLSRLRVYHTFSTTIGTAAITSTDPFAAWRGMIRRIEIRPMGVGSIYSLTGDFAAIASYLDRHFRNPNALFAGANSFTTNPGTGAVTNTVYFDVPIAMDGLQNFPSPVGLYPLVTRGQTPTIFTAFLPIFATTGQVGTGVYYNPGTATATAPTGFAQYEQEYFAPITNPNGFPNGRYYHTWRESQLSINGDGRYELPLLQGAYYSRIAYMVIANGALDTTHMSRLEYVYGGRTTPYDETYNQVLNRQAGIWGSQIPAGIFLHDFVIESHDSRDWLNSAVIAAPRSAITTSGATYGGTQNLIRYAMEEFLPTAAAGNLIGV